MGSVWACENKGRVVRIKPASTCRKLNLLFIAGSAKTTFSLILDWRARSLFKPGRPKCAARLPLIGEVFSRKNAPEGASCVIGALGYLLIRRAISRHLLE
jgi:hypothetical protein